MEYTFIINHALYYAVLQHLQAKARNAGRKFSIDKNEVYHIGETEYTSLSPDEQHCISVLASRTAQELLPHLQKHPDTILARMRPAIVIDLQDSSGSTESFLFDPELT